MNDFIYDSTRVAGFENITPDIQFLEMFVPILVKELLHFVIVPVIVFLICLQKVYFKICILFYPLRWYAFNPVVAPQLFKMVFSVDVDSVLSD